MPHPHPIERLPSPRGPLLPRGWTRLRTLSPSERRLLPRAAGVLALLRIAQLLLPLRLLHRVLPRVSPSPRGRVAATPERLAWSVRAAGRLVPGTTCLTRALALQALLAGRGRASRLHVGFVRTPGGAVRGHAWLEHEGRVLLGHHQHDPARFTTAVVLDSRVRPPRVRGGPPRSR